MTAMTARGIDEYLQLFGLTDEELAGSSFLDAAAGASPFGAQVRELGGTAFATDPAYVAGFSAVFARVQQNLAASATWFSGREDTINRQAIGSDANYQRQMLANATLFLADATAHPGFYSTDALPNLSFADASFDIVLCSNFLFAYGGPSSRQDHYRAITELIRIARSSVRIHPIIDREGTPVPFYDELLDDIRADGVTATHVPAINSWLVGANQTLLLGARR